jgi:hypothetical protein
MEIQEASEGQSLAVIRRCLSSSLIESDHRVVGCDASFRCSLDGGLQGKLKERTAETVLKGFEAQTPVMQAVCLTAASTGRLMATRATRLLVIGHEK